MALDGLQLGHYRLLRLIGSGGMGEVYLAEDPRIRRQVAIKVVRTEVTPYPTASTTQEAARLFLREAKAIAMLDHPNILPLFDYGEQTANGTEFTYLVMPYRQEGSLATWLRERSNSELLSPQDIVHIVRLAAGALQYAHDHQIIHQDVKPSNFLIRSNPDNPGRPDLLLTDFGVAKLSTASSSASHSIRGTPTYMAPEQWEGDPVPATDQYSLAVMIYELLIGHPPFQGPPMRMMYLHTNTQPQLPSTLNPRIPKDIDTVLMHALAKKPDKRFASISAFARAFQQALQGTDALPIIKPPVIKPLNTPIIETGDLHTTLAISEAEARTGTNRTLTLPGGRQVTVSVPQGVHDGQIIRLEGQGTDDPASAIIITITILPTEEISSVSYSRMGETFIPGSSSSRPDSTEAVVYASPSPGAVQSGPDRVKETTPPSLPPLDESSNKRRGPSRGRAILLIGLALLIVLPSVGLLYFTVTNQIAANNASATTQARNAAFASANAATARSNAATAQANSASATAQANADATAQARSVATAQANATATAQANATASALNPNPYPPYRGTLEFNDPLSDNSLGNNWKTYDDGISACKFTGGAYHVIETKNKFFNDCFPESNPNFSNFTYQVQMQIISGDCGGIIFRADATRTKFYFFRICQDGSYALYLYVDNTNANAQTVTSGTNSAINAGLDQTNVIAVVAQGNTLNLYVNQQIIHSVIDSTYSYGHIAVVAQDQGNPTEVAFSNAKVWTL